MLKGLLVPLPFLVLIVLCSYFSLFPSRVSNSILVVDHPFTQAGLIQYYHAFTIH